MHTEAAEMTAIHGLREEWATKVFIISAADGDHGKGKLLFCVFFYEETDKSVWQTQWKIQ